MIKIEHRRTTDLSADAVWEELRHFDRVLHWIPGGDKSKITVHGEGIGAVREPAAGHPRPSAASALGSR